MSEKITITLDKALSEFQKRKDVTPRKDSKNPHYQSSYASLESVIESCRKALDQDITFSQMIDFEIDQNGTRHEFVLTEITHIASGELKRSRCPLKVKDDRNPQAMGSAITYAKRYSLLAIFGLAVDDDADTAIQESPIKEEPKVQKMGDIEVPHNVYPASNKRSF